MNTAAFHDPFLRNARDIVCPTGLGPFDAAKITPGYGIMRTFEGIRDKEQRDYPKQSDLILAAGCAVGLDDGGNCQHFYAGRVKHFIGFLVGQTKNRAVVNTCGSVILKLDGVTSADMGKPVYCAGPNTFSLTRSHGAAEMGAIRFVESNGCAAVAFRRYDSDKPLCLKID
jgi:hypothetical protein